MVRLVVGTRGSALARWQAHHVAEALRRGTPGLEIEERIVRTDGDEPRGQARFGAEERGIFVRRLERALEAGEVDLAVHSLKDMPTDEPRDLVVAAVLERHDPRDALVSAGGSSLAELPAGTLVGTGSFRRRCQILHHRPDLELRSIQGNVDSRLRRLERGEFGALVLALAGLERLGVTAPRAVLDTDVCLPAVGQGAIAVECRRDDRRTLERLSSLEHPPTRLAVEAERAFLRELGGGCLAPATAHARLVGQELLVEGLAGDPEGRHLLIEREVGAPREAERIGARLAARLLVAGASEILARARCGAGDGAGG